MIGGTNCSSAKGLHPLGECATSPDAAVAMLVPVSDLVTSSLSSEDFQTSDITDHHLFNQIADLYSEVMKGDRL